MLARFLFRAALLGFAFFLSASLALGSGGYERTEDVCPDAGWIIKVKVDEVKMLSKEWPHPCQLKVTKLEDLKGEMKDSTLLLSFEKHPTAVEVDDPRFGKVRKWYMLPESGKESDIKEGETWIIFLSGHATKDEDGYFRLLRAEPLQKESAIKEILQSYAKARLSESLEDVSKEMDICIFEARIDEISATDMRLEFQVTRLSTIKGYENPDPKLKLSFEPPFSFGDAPKDANGNAIFRTWYWLPGSKNPSEIKKGETWVFFCLHGSLRRIEPGSATDKIKALFPPPPPVSKNQK